MYDFLIDPFISYAFMRRALVACFALSLGCAPLGVFVVLRRMTLMGDALSHSLLPGVALGFLIAGLSLPAMSLGGFLTASLVALLAGAVSRLTLLREDASLVGFYLISLAFGSLLVSRKGTQVDLMHILFGTVLAVDKASLLLVASITTVTLLIGAFVFRPLVIECFDAAFMRSIKGHGGFYHLLFIMLIVLNLVSAFQAMGTLMALGMMMMPAIAARFWSRNLGYTLLAASLIALCSSYVGLTLSYHFQWPSGPAIILTAGGFYLLSLLFGRYDSMRKRPC